MGLTSYGRAGAAGNQGRRRSVPGAVRSKVVWDRGSGIGVRDDLLNPESCSFLLRCESSLSSGWLLRGSDGAGTTPRLVCRPKDRGFASLSPSHPSLNPATRRAAEGCRLSAIGKRLRPHLSLADS